MATHQKKHIKTNFNRELVLCSIPEVEFYGQITNGKGDARFEVKLLESNMLILAKLTGSLIKGPRKQRVNKDDFVLIQKNLDSNDKYYIIHKYTTDDIKKLKKLGEIKMSKINIDDDDESGVDIIFDGDCLDNNIDEIEINDDFIANI